MMSKSNYEGVNGAGGGGCGWYSSREERAIASRNIVGRMESWVSDYIEPGGGLRDYGGGINLMGLVPTLSRAPGAPDLSPSGLNFVVQPASDEELEDDAASVTSSVASSGYGGGGGSSCSIPGAAAAAGVVYDVQATGARVVGPSPRLSPAVVAGMMMPPLPRWLYSRFAELKDFEEEYGFIVEKPRPGFMMRPRKGKYFKEFEK